MRAYNDDEKVDNVRDFNVGMRNFFDSNNCGDVNYIDVYNMTAHLGLDDPEEVSIIRKYSYE